MSFDKPLAFVATAMINPTEDADVIDLMTADLRRRGVLSSERDAIRLLSQDGYRMGDVALADRRFRQGAERMTHGNPYTQRQIERAITAAIGAA